jgi:hypothetical protein
MIVSTQGDTAGTVNAITLVAGVEPILVAAPNASQAMMLSPWSLGSGNAEAAANPWGADSSHLIARSSQEIEWSFPQGCFGCSRS